MMFFVQAAEESEAEEARARLQVCEKFQTLNSRVWGKIFNEMCLQEKRLASPRMQEEDLLREL